MHVCACMRTHTLNQSRVNIHMFVYSFTYACTHAHIHLHICMCIGACSCVSVCTFIRISAYIYVYSYFCVHICIYLYEKDVWLCIPVYVPACICLYMHTCMLTCMYISICRHMHLEMHSPTYGMCMYVCMIWRVQQGAAVVPAAAYDLQSTAYTCTSMHVTCV